MASREARLHQVGVEEKKRSDALHREATMIWREKGGRGPLIEAFLEDCDSGSVGYRALGGRRGGGGIAAMLHFV
eukprot:1395061-Amorphochlora_amoeboformis.AAC.2